MNPAINTKVSLDDWKEALHKKALALEAAYNADHDYDNMHVHQNNKGWLKLRVREQVSPTGVSISISWYKQEFKGNNKGPRSKGIKRGHKESVLLNNIKKVSKDWEYELAKKYIKDLRPIELMLKDIGKMTRSYNWAIKKLPVAAFDPQLDPAA